MIKESFCGLALGSLYGFLGDALIYGQIVVGGRGLLPNTLKGFSELQKVFVVKKFTVSQV